MNESARADTKLREMLELSEQVRRQPTLKGFLKLVARIIGRPLRDPVGILLASTIVLIILWGRGGELPLVHLVWSGWRPATDPHGRASVIPGVPWDQEWISFAAGFVLLVLVPCALIKWVYKHDLRDYGLGLPARNRLKLSVFSAAFLLVASLPAFLVATDDEGMKDTYPLYRCSLEGWDFVIYEAGYLLFFVALEFVFRGYLLLGLFSVKDRDALPEASGERGPLLFGYYAILISMLSYTAWHLGKPTPELLGTIVWGSGRCSSASRPTWKLSTPQIPCWGPRPWLGPPTSAHRGIALSPVPARS